MRIHCHQVLQRCGLLIVAPDNLLAIQVQWSKKKTQHCPVRVSTFDYTRNTLQQYVKVRENMPGNPHFIAVDDGVQVREVLIFLSASCGKFLDWRIVLGPGKGGAQLEAPS